MTPFTRSQATRKRIEALKEQLRKVTADIPTLIAEVHAFPPFVIDDGQPVLYNLTKCVEHTAQARVLSLDVNNRIACLQRIGTEWSTLRAATGNTDEIESDYLEFLNEVDIDHLRDQLNAAAVIAENRIPGLEIQCQELREDRKEERASRLSNRTTPPITTHERVSIDSSPLAIRDPATEQIAGDEQLVSTSHLQPKVDDVHQTMKAFAPIYERQQPRQQTPTPLTGPPQFQPTSHNPPSSGTTRVEPSLSTHTRPAPTAVSFPSIPAASSFTAAAPLATVSSLPTIAGGRVQVPDFQRPKLEVIKFDGSLTDYHGWKQWFLSSFDSPTIPDAAKAQYLKGLLTGKAATAVDGFNPLDYREMLASLDYAYDRPDLVRDQLLNEVRALQKITRISEIREFCLKIKRLERRLWIVGIPLDSPVQVHELESKLPGPAMLEVRRLKLASKTWNLDRFLESLHSVELMFNDTSQLENRSQQAPKFRALVTKESENVTSQSCWFCSGQHRAFECRKFDTLEKRRVRIREMNKCYRCLQPGHFANKCTKTCTTCSGNHHRLICPKSKFNRTLLTTSLDDESEAGDVELLEEELDAAEAQAKESEIDEPTEMNDEPAETKRCYASKRDGSFLPTVEVEVYGQSVNSTTRTTTLLDSCSDSNYITIDLANRLQLVPLETSELRTEVLGGQSQRPVSSQRVELHLKTTKGLDVKVEAWTISNIVRKMAVFTVINGEVEIVTKEPELLLGIDHFWSLLRWPKKRIGPNHATIESALGPIVIQQPQHFRKRPMKALMTQLLHPENDSDVNEPEAILRDFWTLEDVGLCRLVETQTIDEQIWNEFKNTTTRDSEGRLTVGWLWNGKQNELPSNFEMTFRRTENLMRRVQNNAKLQEEYRAIIDEQLQSDVIERVRSTTNGKLVHYLPHQTVRKDTSTTTRLRLVYDASAAPKGRLSLNDCMHRGPLLLPQLVGMIMRFRLKKIAVVSDIRRAFLQLNLREEDRDVVRFLTPANWSKPFGKDNLQVLRFKRVCFGVICSPSLLAMGLKLHLEENPQMSNVLQDTYVDNLAANYDDEKTAVQHSMEVRDYLKLAAFELREFYSNHRSVIESLDPDNVDKECSVLGMKWKTEDDSFSLRLSAEPPERLTKRKVLSRIARHFDPLGLTTPVLIAAKRFMQKVWSTAGNWDDELPPESSIAWQKIENDWAGSLKFERQITVDSPESTKLIIFSDASDFAFGAVAYLQTQNTSECRTSLLMAKSRIAPVKQPKEKLNIDPKFTIPRLELMGLVMAVRLFELITTELHIDETVIFADSMIAIQQIMKIDGKHPVFVHNRLNELRKARSRIEFRHVAGAENPADVLSRGATWTELEVHSSWWEGPEWVNRQTEWPTTLVVPKTNDVDEQETDEPNFCLQSITTPEIEPEIGTNWIESIQKTIQKLETEGRDATRDAAEILLLRKAQHDHQPGDRKRRRWKMRLDSNGLLRCTTRLQHAELEDSTIDPIWLPSRGQVPQQLISHVHLEFKHAGPNTILAELRRRFVINYQAVKLANDRCAECRLFDAQPFETPDWAQLPAIRVTQGSPFEVTGVDHTGPFHLRDGDSFVLIFVCAKTRAVHMELVKTTNTSDILWAFEKFEARRGCPSMIISDNAKGFKLAAEQLTTRIRATRPFEWRFITPRSPWRGGWWERLNGNVKRSLLRTIGRSSWTSKAVEALLAQIEKVVNSRPLIRPAEGLPILRPIDFLLPNGNEVVVVNTEKEDDPQYEPTHDKLLHRQLRTQHQQQTAKLRRFWEVWQKLYLTSLIHDHRDPKNQRVTTREPKLNESVVVYDENKKRINWITGKIKKIIRGSDDVVRTLDIELPNGTTLRRPINLIYPIEVQEEQPEPENVAHENVNLGEVEVEAGQEERPQASSRPTRAAKTRAKTNIKSWTTQLFALCALTCLFARSEAQQPFVCGFNAPTILWALPKLARCDYSKLKDQNETEVALELFEINHLRYESQGWKCRYDVRRHQVTTDPDGLPNDRQTEEPTIRMTKSDCEHMIRDKTCAFGTLTRFGSVWKTTEEVKDEQFPGAIRSFAFGPSTVITKNCIVEPIRVYAEYGNPQPTSLAADLSHCAYDDGGCVLTSTEAAFWEPNKNQSQKFHSLGRRVGFQIGQIWIDPDRQIVLTFSNKSTYQDGLKLILTEQNYAVIVENRFRRHSNSDVAAKDQFVIHKLMEAVRPSIREVCRLIEITSTAVRDLIKLQPRPWIQRAFNTSAVHVETISSSLFKIHLCNELRLVQFTKTSECRARPPISSKDLDSRIKWTLNPTTLEVTEERDTKTCLSEFAVFKIGGSYKQLDHRSGLLEDYPLHRPEQRAVAVWSEEPTIHGWDSPDESKWHRQLVEDLHAISRSRVESAPVRSTIYRQGIVEEVVAMWPPFWMRIAWIGCVTIVCVLSTLCALRWLWVKSKPATRIRTAYRKDRPADRSSDVELTSITSHRVQTRAESEPNDKSRNVRVTRPNSELWYA